MNSKSAPNSTLLDSSIALDRYLETLLKALPDSDVRIDHESVPSKTFLTSGSPRSGTVPPFLLTDSRPSWAQQEFSALAFTVDRLNLLTPLVELERTQKFPSKITPFPGQPAWVLGLAEIVGEKIGIIDTAQLLSRQNHRLGRGMAMSTYNNLIVIKNKNWAFACNSISETCRLLPGQIRWRQRRKSADRPWLLGMSADHLAALVDLGRLIPVAKG